MTIYDIPDDIQYVVPSKWILIHYKLLKLLSQNGEELIKDCGTCNSDQYKNGIECYNIFRAALAAEALGETKKASLFINYIDSCVSKYITLDYPVVYKLNGVTYEIYKDLTVKIVETKQANPIKVLPRDLTYDGNSQELLIVTDAEGPVKFKIGSEVYDSIPERINAGSYTIHWTCEGNDDYLPASGSVTTTIEKRNQVISWIKQPKDEYLVNSKLLVGADIKVTDGIGNIDYSYNLEHFSVGDYIYISNPGTLLIQAEGDDNTNPSNILSKTIAIKEKDVSYYIGQVQASKTDFRNLTEEQLVASLAKTEFATGLKSYVGTKSCFVIAVPEDVIVDKCYYISGGITTVIHPNSWNLQHSPITIDGVTYTVYGYRIGTISPDNPQEFNYELVNI